MSLIERGENYSKNGGTYTPKTYSFTDVMPFGKHKGERIEDLIEHEPKYLGHMLDCGYIKLDNEAEALQEYATE